jgi:putative hydroxymethylpyrimidine transport system substrate-binding protein
MKVPFLSIVAAVIALLAGCGEGSGPETTERSEPPRELREVGVSLNRQVGSEHVGFLMAEANGYFADAGLKVVLSSPASPSWSIKYLLSDLVNADFAVSHEPQVAIAVDNGLPIVAVGSLISQPTASFIWLKQSGIDRISDLKGKTIAVPGLPFQIGFLEDLLAGAGLKLEDVTIRRVGYEAVPFLVSGRADAIFGGSASLEGVELRSRGLEPVITPVQGIPAYDELVLTAATDVVSKEPQLIRDFMAALSRGTAAAARNPRKAVREIENDLEPSPVSNRKAREAQVASVLPLLSRTGYMDPAQASRLVEWMREEGMISRVVPVSDLLTNDYVEQP